MAEIDELRAQPQDILAEQSVLGAIFLDESKLVFVREYIEPADFFKYANRLIVVMRLMRRLFAIFWIARMIYKTLVDSAIWLK